MINVLTNRINTEEEKLFHCIFSYLDFLPFSRRAEDDLLGKTDSVAEGTGVNAVNAVSAGAPPISLLELTM